MTRRAVASLAAFVVLGAAAPAFADGAAPDEAGALFEQARDLMGQGLFGDACPKLARSLQIAPTGRTKLALAMCHEGEGRLATALGEFADARAQAQADGRADRVTLADDHTRAIEGRVSRITIVVPSPPPSGAPSPSGSSSASASSASGGLAVTIDGVPVDPARWGTPIPVDGGAHLIRATEAGRKPWESTFRVASSGETPSVEVPPFAPLDAPSPAALSTPPIETAPHKRAVPLAGWIVGGVGLAAVGVGAYFGVAALGKQNDAGPYCHGTVCQSTGVDLVSQARTRAEIADASFAVGAVALGVAVYLAVHGLVAAPDRPASAAPSPSNGGAPYGSASFSKDGAPTLSFLPDGVVTMAW